MAGQGLLSLKNLPDSSAADAQHFAAESPLPNVMSFPPSLKRSKSVLETSVTSFMLMDLLAFALSSTYFSSYDGLISNKDHPAP